MLRRFLWTLALLASLLSLAAVIACEDDEEVSEAERQEIEQFIREIAATSGDNPEDVEFFLDHVTDSFLEDFTGYTREECRENAEDCVGEPSEDVRIENIEVDGDRAEADVTFLDGEEEFEARLELVREDDVWMVDGFGAAAVEIPEGVKPVEVVATDHEFEFDVDEIEDGNIAFTLENEGEEEHELIVVKVTEDFDINTLLEEAGGEGEEPEGEGAGQEGEEEELPGVEAFSGFTFAGPGDTTNLVFEESPLEPGRYVMACFVETEEGESHASLGMHAEFEVPE